VHRRVAAIFAVADRPAFGVRAYLNTPIEAFPDVTNAQVTVIAQMPGYAPEEIERSDHRAARARAERHPAHDAAAQREPVRLSLVTLTFDDDADPFISRMQVAQRMAQADLPDGVTPSSRPRRRRSARSTSSA
jgi:cobalt-zinc-cadmium resistance protein CzcA